MRLRDKSGFITGGTSGIGLATAKVFVAEGAFVGMTGRNSQSVEDALAQLGDNAAGFVADAADDDAMASALEETSARRGGIDVLFANAGHYVHTPLGQTSRGDLEEQFGVIINSFMTVQTALPYLRPGSSIVLMSSVYATMGPPGAGAYAASKAATMALARSFASELAPRGIRVNVVVPGAVDTPSWGLETKSIEDQEKTRRLLGERAPHNRMIRAEEVARTVLFLASQDSSGLQAAEIVVDGGTTGALAGSPRYMRGEP